MRRGLLILGTVLILTAIVVALDSWSPVVVVKNQRHVFDQIEIGMRLEQIKALLGSEGELRYIYGPPSVSPGHQGPVSPMILELRWEDAYETVDVRFRGSSVDKITRQPKDPLDVEQIQRSRLMLAILATTGLALLLTGLLVQPNSSRTPSA